MTLYAEVIDMINKNGSASVIPFQVTALVMNELTDTRSEFNYDEYLIGYLLCMWAKQSTDSTTNRLSFVKNDKKLIVYKNF